MPAMTPFEHLQEHRWGLVASIKLLEPLWLPDATIRGREGANERVDRQADGWTVAPPLIRR